MSDLSFSPLGAMQITTGCEIFALVINSLHPFCTRTILPTLPSMSVFIKDYLAHCVLKNSNFTLNTFPENKIQSCLTCYAFKFPTAASVSHCLPLNGLIWLTVTANQSKVRFPQSLEMILLPKAESGPQDPIPPVQTMPSAEVVGLLPSNSQQ